MKSLLVINSSAAREGSVSRTLVEETVARLLETHPFAEVVRRDLGDKPVPHLSIETLEVRGRDALDFQEVVVAALKDALDAAHRAGQAELLAAAMALLEARDNQMLTPTDWRRLRRAVRRAHKTNTRPRP